MRKTTLTSWVMWGGATLFLFYEFFIRVFPTVMVKELLEAFRITATSFGTLSAFYFYAYAPMQIPVGILMDRFGAQRLLALASLTCAVGSFLFAIANQLGVAETGRFLMGLGSAFGFVGMIYVCSNWFPPRRLALLVGLGNSLGMLGALGAEGPLSSLVEKFGWRPTVQIFSFAGAFLFVTFCLLAILRPQKSPSHPKAKSLTIGLLKDLKLICCNYKIYLNGLVALLFYSTTAGFASLWGTPFLIQKYGMEKSLAGYIISMTFLGWIVGGPLIGLISDRFKRRKPFLLIGILLTGISLIPVIYVDDLPIWLLFVLLLFVGIFSSAQLLNFSLSLELNPGQAKGTSIALTNFIVAFGSSIIQPFLGFLLDKGSDGTIKDGLPFYSAADYKQAMISFPLTLLLAFLLLLFLDLKPLKTEGFGS